MEHPVDLLSSARILIVDDTPANVALLEAMLEDAGCHHVTGVLDARQALDLHRKDTFDLILLDMRMPYMDGHDVLRCLNEGKREDDYVPVLVLTAETDEETRLRALRAGAHDFVTKPFNQEEVLSRITNMLEVRRLYRDRLVENAYLAETVEEQARRLQAIMDSAPDVILTTNAEERVTTINAAGRQVFHVDMTGQSVRDMFGLKGALTPGTLEVAASRPDGSVFPMELSVGTLGETSRDGCVITGRDITKRKLLEEELSWLAWRDAVTELPNRFALRRELQDRVGRGDSPAVLVALLEGHRLLSDLFGATLTERLLRDVGDRLSDWAASVGGVVGSWSDGALAVILPEPSDVQATAQALHREVARTWSVNGHEVRLGCQVGIALSPDHGESPDTLFRRATLAAEAGGGVVSFTPEMEARAADWHCLESALRSAIEDDQLQLLYQPKVDLRSGRMSGVEALMRWTHPQLGAVSPVRFIPVAEATGMIDQLGAWAIRRAARDAVAWGSLPVAVNVSVHQLGKPLLAETVEAVVSEGLEPQALELEITESAVMDNVEQTIGALDTLRGFGVGLAIDDFGTGYSSLSYLSRLPLTTLKVDQSFVRDLGTRPESGAIIDMVLGLAKALGLRTVAEGIETVRHADILREAGCALGQGWLFARPLSADGVLDWLVRDKVRA